MTVKLALTIGAVLAASPGSPRRRKARSPAGLSFTGRALAVVERGRRHERSYRGSRPQASSLDRDQRGHEHDHGERDDHPPDERKCRQCRADQHGGADDEGDPRQDEDHPRDPAAHDDGRTVHPAEFDANPTRSSSPSADPYNGRGPFCRLMPRHKTGNRGRKRTTAETMSGGWGPRRPPSFAAASRPRPSRGSNANGNDGMPSSASPSASPPGSLHLPSTATTPRSASRAILPA